MPVYFTNNISGNQAELPEEESRHCIKVLRLKKGDTIRFVDGTGGLFQAVIEVPDPRSCKLSITGRTENYLDRGYNLHIAIAPTKSTERFEWFLEKATEIGVDEITPLICEHSERKKIRIDRCRRILLSAMKQSGRATLPNLNEAVDFSTLINNPYKGKKLIAHCRVELDQYAGLLKGGDHDWLVLIGPEGDFTDTEIKEAIHADFNEISLGEAVLRTETAGIVACQVIADLNRK